MTKKALLKENECEFLKTKGIGATNYGAVTTRTSFNDDALSVNIQKSILMVKKKPVEHSITYGNIESIGICHFFAKGDLIGAGIVFIIGLFVSPFIGFLIGAFLTFCAYGKLITIKQKNGSAILIQTGAFEGEQIEKFFKLADQKKETFNLSSFSLNKTPKKILPKLAIAAGIALVITIIASISTGSSFLGGDPIDNILEKMETRVDEVMNYNSEGKDFSENLAYITKFQKDVQKLAEELSQYEDEMSEEQLARFYKLLERVNSY